MAALKSHSTVRSKYSGRSSFIEDLEGATTAEPEASAIPDADAETEHDNDAENLDSVISEEKMKGSRDAPRSIKDKWKSVVEAFSPG
jgi:hypothetical protein